MLQSNIKHNNTKSKQIHSNKRTQTTDTKSQADATITHTHSTNTHTTQTQQQHTTNQQQPSQEHIKTHRNNTWKQLTNTLIYEYTT